MGMKSATESALVQACLDLLKLRGILCWRAGNHGVRRTDQTGRTFWTHKGLRGVSDILGVLPGGRILAIECKLPKAEVTEAQQWFLETVQALGGLAGVCRSVADLERLLGQNKNGGRDVTPTAKPEPERGIVHHGDDNDQQRKYVESRAQRTGQGYERRDDPILGHGAWGADPGLVSPAPE
jgi:hypothetical protein